MHTSTDRCACNGPSYASVVPGTFSCYFETRAHATEQTMGRHNCDGPSSGNRHVINEVYPTRPDLARPFFKIKTFKIPNPSFHPHYFIIPLISPLFSTSTLSQPPIISLSQFSKALKCYLLVETAAVSGYLATEYVCICFSPFLRYVSLNLYSVILPCCLLVSIMLSSSSYVVYFRLFSLT